MVVLESLKSSVDALEKAAATTPTAASHQVHDAHPSRFGQSTITTQQPENPLMASSEHQQKPVAYYGAEFITEDEERQLITFLESKRDQFVTEGDRSTLSFGEQYKCSGSRSSNSTITIPPAIASLVEKISTVLSTDEATRVNSCLVNCFEGPSFSLPAHSDDEPNIHPESSIVTVSLGQGCTLRFDGFQ